MRCARDSLGMSRQDLAVAAGLKIDTLEKWETGRARPSAEGLVAVAAALGMTVDAVIENG